MLTFIVLFVAVIAAVVIFGFLKKKKEADNKGNSDGNIHPK
jgi:hypothetical protein